jgi:ABC-2 type transport system ATP-binding protein
MRRPDQVDGSPAQWWSALRGVQSIEGTNGLLTLELEDGVDEQGVLDAARRAGRVTHFSSVTPSLTDLFRKAVGA